MKINKITEVINHFFEISEHKKLIHHQINCSKCFVGSFLGDSQSFIK